MLVIYTLQQKLCGYKQKRNTHYLMLSVFAVTRASLGASSRAASLSFAAATFSSSSRGFLATSGAGSSATLFTMVKNQ